MGCLDAGHGIQTLRVSIWLAEENDRFFYGIEEGTDLELGLINLAPKNCNVIITY